MNPDSAANRNLKVPVFCHVFSAKNSPGRFEEDFCTRFPDNHSGLQSQSVGAWQEYYEYYEYYVFIGAPIV